MIRAVFATKVPDRTMTFYLRTEDDHNEYYIEGDEGSDMEKQRHLPLW